MKANTATPRVLAPDILIDKAVAASQGTTRSGIEFFANFARSLLLRCGVVMSGAAESISRHARRFVSKKRRALFT